MPGFPSVGGDETEAQVECRAHFGPALDLFSYVPAVVADRLVGPMADDDELTCLKSQCHALGLEIARLHGLPPSTREAKAVLALLARDANAEEGWSLRDEKYHVPILRVISAARNEINAIREATAAAVSPF